MGFGIIVIWHCCRRRWAHTPKIHAASHVDDAKIVAWFSISLHACGSGYGALLDGPLGCWSSRVFMTCVIEKSQDQDHFNMLRMLEKLSILE